MKNTEPRDFIDRYNRSVRIPDIPDLNQSLIFYLHGMIIVLKDRFSDSDDLIYEGFRNLEKKLYKFFSMHFYNKNLGNT